MAAAVSERCEKQSKSVEQCNNKGDNLKKRYKLERHRMSDGGITASHWPWCKKMEEIVGNSMPAKAVADEDKVVILIAREIAITCRLGVEIPVIVGDRNFFCGDTWVATTGLDKSTAYQIGMMASLMISILLQSSLEKMGVQTRVQTAFSVQEVAEPYSRKCAIGHLEKVQAEAVVKGTNVDGVYDCHSQDNNATFRDLFSRGATAMDMMALTFCEENSIPVVVFTLLQPGKHYVENQLVHCSIKL